MSSEFNAEKLQKHIGVQFKNVSLLKQSMMHASYDADREDGEKGDNERLEFLGDRVLGLVIARLLFEKFPSSNEGDLALRFNALVRKESCTQVAQNLGLDRFILLGASEKKASAKRQKSILGNLTEALLGAIFLDQGFEKAREFIITHWAPLLETIETPMRDAKTALQEWAQGRGLPLPQYIELARQGPDHSPRFTIEIAIEGFGVYSATAGSKRRAQQEAAKMFLIANNIWEMGDE